MELTPAPAPAGTIPSLIAQRVASHGGETILRKKDRGIWKPMTWTDLHGQAASIGQGLLAAGFGRGEVAAVMSTTRPEAVQADLAIITAGGCSIAIHPDEEAHRVAHIIRTSGCRFIFVENEEQLDKVLSIREDCPALARIVIFDMKGLREFMDPQCRSLSVFCARTVDDVGWEAAVAAVQPGDTAILLFPPGDSLAYGQPLTHADVLHMVAAARQRLGVQPGDERLAVLPMSDVMERVLGLYLSLDARVISNYLESPETAVENLQQLQPSVFGADAEAWERLHARITRLADNATWLQRRLYRWAVGTGGGGLPNLLVLRAVRQELGMGKLRVAYVGAPVDPAIMGWAQALGIMIMAHGGVADTGGDERYKSLMAAALGAG